MHSGPAGSNKVLERNDPQRHSVLKCNRCDNIMSSNLRNFKRRTLPCCRAEIVYLCLEIMLNENSLSDPETNLLMFGFPNSSV